MSVGASHKVPLTEKGPDWELNTRIMDQTEQQLMRIRRVVRIYDVPYLAGYSLDGKTIYIDRLMPMGFTWRRRTVRTDRYLLVHECVEKALIMMLHLHYLHAHQIAERAEESAVVADGIPIKVYNDFMNKQIDIIGKRPIYDRCPPDLDMTPYHDEHDAKTIDRMKFSRAA